MSKEQNENNNQIPEEQNQEQITPNLDSKQHQDGKISSSAILNPDLAELELGSSIDQENEASEDEIDDIREEIATWNSAEEEEQNESKVTTSEINLKGKLDECDRLFLEELPKIYRRKSSQLKQILKKDLLINVDNKYYYCLFTNEELKVTKENKKSDTSIKISEDVLEKILNSQLNPQIALLNNKVSIDGNFQAGLYFFNLLNI